MKKIKIDPQEKYVWLSFDDLGWIRFSGLTLTICGIECSVVVRENESLESVEMIFSDLYSGSKILSINLSFLDVINADTKQNYLILVNKHAEKVVERFVFNGLKRVKNAIKQRKIEIYKKFGDMPAIEIDDDAMFSNYK